MKQGEMVFNITVNGSENLDDTIRKTNQLVEVLTGAQELIDSILEKVDVNGIAEKLANEIAKISGEEKQEEGQKEELDIPHKILKLIFDEYPEGVTIRETTGILNEARKLVDETLIV